MMRDPHHRASSSVISGNIIIFSCILETLQVNVGMEHQLSVSEGFVHDSVLLTNDFHRFFRFSIFGGTLGDSVTYGG